MSKSGNSTHGNLGDGDSVQKRKSERIVYGFVDLFMPGGNNIERIYEIDQTNLSIGRDHRCSIRINNLRVSRHQCNIIQECKGYGRFQAVLQNLTSRPTTLVENREICDQGKVQLLDGCRFKIFDRELRWRLFNPKNPSGQVDQRPAPAVVRLSDNGQIAQNKTSSSKRSSSSKSSSGPSSKSGTPLTKRRSSDLDLRKSLLQKSLRNSVKEKSNFDEGNSCLLESQHSILEESSDLEIHENPDFTPKNVSEDLINFYTPEASLASPELIDFDSSHELTRSVGKLHDEGNKRSSLNELPEEASQVSSSHKEQLSDNIQMLSQSQNDKDGKSDDLSDVSTQSVQVNEDVGAETQLIVLASQGAQGTEDPSVEDLESEMEEFIAAFEEPIQTKPLNKSSLSQKEFDNIFDDPVVETYSEMFTQVVTTPDNGDPEPIEVDEDSNGELDVYEVENLEEQYVHLESNKSSPVVQSEMSEQVEEISYGGELEAPEENEDFTSVDMQNTSVLERSDVNVRVVKEYSEDGNGETNVFESEGLENHSALERSSVTGTQELFTSEDVDASEKVNSFYAPEMSTISDRIHDLNSSHVSTQNILPDEEIKISSPIRLREESSTTFSSHKNDNIGLLTQQFKTKMVENDESGSFLTSEDEEIIDLNSHGPPVTTVLPNDSEDIKISSQNKLLEESNISFSAAHNDNIELLIHSETKMAENDESFLTSEDVEEVIIDLNSHGPPETRILSSEEINISARPKESNTPLSSAKNDNIKSFTQPKIALNENDKSETFLNSEDEKTANVNFNCSTQSTTDERIEGLSLSKLPPEASTSFSPHKNDNIELPTESETETEENHGSESLLDSEEFIDFNSQEGSTQIVSDERVDGPSLNQLPPKANTSFLSHKNDTIELRTQAETEAEGNYDCASLSAAYSKEIDLNSSGSSQSVNFSDERIDASSVNHLLPEAKTSVSFSFRKNDSVELFSQSENDREEDDDELGEEVNTSSQSHKDSNVEFLAERKTDTEEVHEISSTSKGMIDLNSSQESIQSIELPDQGTTRPSLNLMREEPNISSSHKDDNTEFFSQADTDKEAKKDDLKTVSNSGGIIELNPYDSIRKSKRSSINQLGEESNTSSQSHNNIEFLADPKTDTEESEDHEICSTAKDEEHKVDEPETASAPEVVVVMDAVDQPHPLTPKRCSVTLERLILKGLTDSENEDEMEATNTRRLTKSAKKSPVPIAETQKRRLREKVVLLETVEPVKVKPPKGGTKSTKKIQKAFNTQKQNKRARAEDPETVSEEETEEVTRRPSKSLKLTKEEGKVPLEPPRPRRGQKARAATPEPEEVLLLPRREGKARVVTPEPKEIQPKRGRKARAVTPEPEKVQPERVQPKRGRKARVVTPEPKEIQPKRGRKARAVTPEPEKVQPERVQPKRERKTRAVTPEPKKVPPKQGRKARAATPETEEVQPKRERKTRAVTPEPKKVPPKQGRKARAATPETEEVQPKRGQKTRAVTPEPKKVPPKQGRKARAATPEIEEVQPKRGQKTRAATPETEEVQPKRGRKTRAVTPEPEAEPEIIPVRRRGRRGDETDGLANKNETVKVVTPRITRMRCPRN